MKTLRFLILLIVLAGYGSLTGSAQALVQKDFNWYLRTDEGLYPAVETMAVFTPSGNILHIQIFMIDPDESIVPEKGVNKISFITWVPYDGIIQTMVDAEGIVYPDGKCRIIFHLNGAGSQVPPKKVH